MPVPRSPWIVGWSASLGSTSHSYFLTWPATHSFHGDTVARLLEDPQASGPSPCASRFPQPGESFLTAGTDHNRQRLATHTRRLRRELDCKRSAIICESPSERS